MRRFQGATTKACIKCTLRRSNAEIGHYFASLSGRRILASFIVARHSRTLRVRIVPRVANLSQNSQLSNWWDLWDRGLYNKARMAHRQISLFAIGLFALCATIILSKENKFNWSTHSFRYACLVTTSPMSPSLPLPSLKFTISSWHQFSQIPSTNFH